VIKLRKAVPDLKTARVPIFSPRLRIFSNVYRALHRQLLSVTEPSSPRDYGNRDGDKNKGRMR
jgi:hypothetical protein